MMDPISQGERLCSLVARMAAYRAEVVRIKGEMKADQCSKEDHPGERRLIVHPCWKATVNAANESDSYEERTSILDDDSEWCDACLEREIARKPLAAAVQRLGHLKAQITQTGQRLLKSATK